MPSFVHFLWLLRFFISSLVHSLVYRKFRSPCMALADKLVVDFSFVLFFMRTLFIEIIVLVHIIIVVLVVFVVFAIGICSHFSVNDFICITDLDLFECNLRFDLIVGVLFFIDCSL